MKKRTKSTRSNSNFDFKYKSNLLKSKFSQAVLGLVIVFIIFLAIGGLFYFVLYKPIPNQNNNQVNKTRFCGSSTNASCSSDNDCMTGGCSGQICQGKNEEPIITTCEYRDCYDAAGFGVSCGCVEGKCRWD